MRGFLSGLYFGKPLFFYLLLLIPFFWLRLRSLPFWAVLWRTAIVFLLIFALADPQRRSTAQVTEMGERIFAFDLSRSIPGAVKLWMEKSARENFRPLSGDRVFVFAGEAVEVRDWERWMRGEARVDSIRPGETNLEKLFSKLLALPGTPRAVFLYTDGWETRGELERLFPALSDSGLRVFPMLPPDKPQVVNVAVKKILGPHLGASGEAASFKVLIENQGPKEAEGDLVLRRDGEPIRSEVLRLKPGSHILTYRVTLPAVPMASFRATFVPRGPDLIREDNEATAWVSIKSREKALIFNGPAEARYLGELLERRGYEVTAVGPASAPPSPSPYAFVIFNNVGKERFPREYLAQVERYVTGGGGFLILGDEASFGPRSYQGTPIEHLLPVAYREPPKPEEKKRALILIIDKSGSMREGDRLLYAREAAKAMVDQLGDRDLLGVVGFDVEPFTVVPLSPVGKIRASAALQIDRLKAGGRTYLYPAIVEAKRQLEKEAATAKHVIILSDGETGGSGGEYVDLVTLMKKALKITTSAVAIGDQANIPLLKRIAQYGGGFFHHTYDPRTLPEIVLDEMREWPQEKEPPPAKDFVPVAVEGSQILSSFPPSYPRLQGYMETELKGGADLDLAIERQGRRDPLLASLSYGRGKAAAFTADLSGRWTRDWIRWDSLAPFWDKVFEWLQPKKKETPDALPPHEVRINLEEGRPVVELYIYGEESDGSLFRFSYLGVGQSGEGALTRIARGYYRAKLPFSRPGDYRIELTEERQGKKLPYPPLGYSIAFNPTGEVVRGDFNIPILERLARLTHGQINPPGLEIEGEKTIHASRPLRFYVLVLTPVLFFLEIVFRRLFSGLRSS